MAIESTSTSSGLSSGPPLHLEDLAHGRGRERGGPEAVERLGGKGDDPPRAQRRDGVVRAPRARAPRASTATTRGIAGYPAPDRVRSLSATRRARSSTSSDSARR